MGNFFKSLSSVAILILLVFLCFAFAVSTTETNPDENSTKTIVVENPSATFCEENGGDYIEIENHDKSKWGICNFNDGSSCTAQSFFIGKCRKGDSNNKNFDFKIVKTLQKTCLSDHECGAVEEFIHDNTCLYEMHCIEKKCSILCPEE